MDADWKRVTELLSGYAMLTGSSRTVEFDNRDLVEIDAGDGIIINIAYRPIPRELHCFATAAYLEPETELATLRHLLQRTDFTGGGRGFSFSIEPDTERIVTHDVRPLDYFTDSTVLGAWIEACLENVNEVTQLVTGAKAAQSFSSTNNFYQQV